MQIEDVEAMKQVAAEFDLDIEMRRNSTAAVSADIDWTASSRSIVQSVYSRDFDVLGYSK